MRFKNLTIDVDKCTACRVCELVCSFKHEGLFSPSLSRIRVVRLHDAGVNVPIVCVNCAQPPCMEVCPTGAVYMDRDVPVVRINESECIGCRECIEACPFGAVDFNPVKEVAIMCDLCEGEPVCVANCIYGALTYREATDAAQRERRLAARLMVASEREHG